MRGLGKTGCQILACLVQHLMPAILPQKTAGHIVDSALVSDEDRGPVATSVLSKFRSGKPSHVADAFQDDGETLMSQSLPVAESKPI